MASLSSWIITGCSFPACPDFSNTIWPVELFSVVSRDPPPWSFHRWSVSRTYINCIFISGTETKKTETETSPAPSILTQDSLRRLSISFSVREISDSPG